MRRESAARAAQQEKDRQAREQQQRLARLEAAEIERQRQQHSAAMRASFSRMEEIINPKPPPEPQVSRCSI
jgi:hypothetical protein